MSLFQSTKTFKFKNEAAEEKKLPLTRTSSEILKHLANLSSNWFFFSFRREVNELPGIIDKLFSLGLEVLRPRNL